MGYITCAVSNKVPVTTSTYIVTMSIWAFEPHNRQFFFFFNKAIARSLDCKIWAKPARLKTWTALQENRVAYVQNWAQHHNKTLETKVLF